MGSQDCIICSEPVQIDFKEFIQEKHDSFAIRNYISDLVSDGLAAMFSSSLSQVIRMSIELDFSGFQIYIIVFYVL